MKKRLITVVILSASILALGGCNGKQSDLKTKGMELISLMDEKASSEPYAEILSGGGEVAEKVLQFGEGDYTTPSRVFEIKLPQDEYLEGMGADLSNMSETLKEDLYDRIGNALCSTLNGQEGAVSLAAASVAQSSTAFVGELKTDVIYLYQFEDKGNAVMVSFAPAEENVISASAMFLANEEWNSLETAEEIQDYLSLTLGGLEGIEVTALD